MRDWEALRRAAVEGGESLASLSRRTGIPYTTLLNRAVKEGWDPERDAPPFSRGERDIFGRIAGKLLRRIEENLDAEQGLDFKELKTVTGALKELQSLGEAKDGGDGGGLTVRFVGEAEEMSV